MIGAITGKPVDQRLAGSIAAALAGVARGAAIIRVHDVAATKDALDVWQAVEDGGK
jgi:dihydropteroate synthase